MDANLATVVRFVSPQIRAGAVFVIFDLIPESTKAAGLSALMKGAGKFTRFIPIPQPTLLVGPGSSGRLGQAVAGFGHAKLLIVTDPMIAKLGLLNDLTTALQANGANYVVFDRITPDAPIPLIEECIEFYKNHGCDAIIAIGGGSSIDASKAVACAVANPKPLHQLAGYFKGFANPVKLYAVPTTAGTGSEVTVAAVMSDPAAGKKMVIIDPRLVPKMAALDPNLMTGLPPAITAATGIDALTHAVEAFVGNWKTPQSDAMALSAISLIFENLPKAYHHGSDLEAREKMSLASTYAGLAFTRANVGYVHAIAHQFGGKYHTPHGLANAIMLPHVLRFSLPSIVPKLAQLAVRAKIGGAMDDEETLAQAFIDAVQAMNDELGIPRTLAALQEDDISNLAKAACFEAETGYPVPRYMSLAQCEEIIRSVLPGAAQDVIIKKPAAAKKRSTKKTA
jgi:alcohol dehydrogenase class IV